MIPEEDESIVANPILLAFPVNKTTFREGFGYIYEVERSITEVGFDYDFESL